MVDAVGQLPMRPVNVDGTLCYSIAHRDLVWALAKITFKAEGSTKRAKGYTQFVKVPAYVVAIPNDTYGGRVLEESEIAVTCFSDFDLYEYMILALLV